jgi:hypothetical protein
MPIALIVRYARSFVKCCLDTLPILNPDQDIAARKILIGKDYFDENLTS